MVYNLFKVLYKKWSGYNLAAFSLLSVFLSPSFVGFFPFYSHCPPFPFTLHPPLISGSGSFSWGSNCYIVGKRGTLCFLLWFWAQRNRREFVRSCPGFLGNGYLLYICLQSVILLADIHPWLALVRPVFCSYHLAEVIHTGAEMIAWPSWYFYLFNIQYNSKSEQPISVDLIRQSALHAICYGMFGARFSRLLEMCTTYAQK